MNKMRLSGAYFICPVCGAWGGGILEGGRHTEHWACFMCSVAGMDLRPTDGHVLSVQWAWDTFNTRNMPRW